MANRNGGFIGTDGLDAPDPPTAVTPTAGDTEVSVAFTAPTDTGTSAITGFNVQSNDGSGTIFPSYDVENASYYTKSFSVSSQDTFPTGVVFNPSGTKMYVVGNGTDKIYEYDLSTANDVSTAVYNSVSFDNSSQATAATGVVFNNDGTKMYIVSGGLSRFVYQYSLSTAYNVSSASYDSVSLNVGNESTDPTDLRFNNDGSKLFVLQAASADSVFQYSLTSNFDLSTASYDSVSFSVSGQETTPTSLAFNSDGTKMFILGTAADAVFQYSLSSAFNLSNVSYDDVSFDVSSQENQPRGLAFNNYGDKLYVVGYAQDTVYQFSTGTAAGDYPTASPVTVTGLTNGTSYTFNVWAINAYGYSAPSDASAAVSPVEAVFVLVGGLGSYTDAIDRFNINSSANATDFGNLTGDSRGGGAAVGAATRLVFVGGRDGSSAHYNTMQYVNPVSAGNTANFGNLTESRTIPAAFGNSTRGIMGGGEGNTSTVTMDYITIASTGNAQDFGDLSEASVKTAGFASPTRGVRTGGGANNGSGQNIIEYVTIANTGNVTDFGDLTAGRLNLAAASSATRGLSAGGSGSLVIDFVTIASAGNATDFGDLAMAGDANKCRGGSSLTKAVFFKNNTQMSITTIASTGDGTDFGDVLSAGDGGIGYMAASNGHGGLT